LTISHEKLGYISSQDFDFIKLFFIFNINLNGASNEQKEASLWSAPNHRPVAVLENSW
jgi:hypothetical protein